MAGSPMMILWPNSDGSVTLSQVSENEPKVVSNPPRKATFQTALSTLAGPALTLSFSVPSSGQSSEDIIYGLSLHRPSSDVGASIQVHNFKGNFNLDLTRTVADLPSSMTDGTGSSSNTLPLPTGNESNQSYWPPLSSWEKMMVAHGVVSALGFCLFLPIGVLQARFLRIWWPKWFKTHWIIQFVLAGLTVVAGVGLGVAAVHQSGGSHFSDKHMIIGLVLFLLYIGQALYGYVIHKVKKANRTRRPIQNYGHAIIGLGLIALAMYQVWLGFDDEWSDITGRDKPSHGLYTFWTVWIAVLGGAYLLGLALLPKQYSGEAQAAHKGAGLLNDTKSRIMWTSGFRSLLGIGLLALSSGQQVLAANGGSWCTNFLCVGATISEGNTYYSLNTSLPFSRVGWMAVGFGDRMGGSPMVILWPNADGTITLSQRQSNDHDDPQVVKSPPRTATLQTTMSTLTGSAVTLSFSIPSSGHTTENMIYALATRKPGSNDPSATLQEHNFKGNFQLDLTQTVPDLPSPSASNTAAGTGTPTSSTLPVPTQAPGTNDDEPFFIPYSSYEKKLLPTGIERDRILLLSPIAVLQARFLRIWWPRWFKAHWIVQFGLAGPCIVLGFALGIVAVRESGATHFGDTHMILGLVLVILYALQALYGYIIHVVKSPNRKRRPIQNYGHAVVGLAVIVLAFYQVWTGFDVEWSKSTGRDKPKHGLYLFWTVWAGVLGAAYILGLALLPKQYKTEAQAVRNREKSNETLGSKEDVS
ncbi:cytochrome b561 domain-containing protein [Ceratobasidium sp. AG-Ba]|nr:cytochrome b561 domain-containing protein [Ceratobasidium sp. AG-Ba]